MTDGLNAALKKSGMELNIDVSAGFAGVLAIKDLAARDSIMKAAEYSTKVLRKFVVKQMEDIIDEEKKVSQSDLADMAEDAIKDPSKFDPSIQLKSEDLDSCYSPIIQSGSRDDKFDLRPSAQSSNNPLAYDTATTIIIQLGARYKNYWSGESVTDIQFTWITARVICLSPHLCCLSVLLLSVLTSAVPISLIPLKNKSKSTMS